MSTIQNKAQTVMSIIIGVVSVAFIVTLAIAISANSKNADLAAANRTLTEQNENYKVYVTSACMREQYKPTGYLTFAEGVAVCEEFAETIGNNVDGIVDGLREIIKNNQ